jgi:hypothetical protein
LNPIGSGVLHDGHDDERRGIQLPVARETVWEKLNDAETLKACIRL